MRRILISLLLLVVVAPASAGVGLSISELRPHLDEKTAQAISLFKSRKYDEALRALGAPADEAARLLEARTLAALGRFAPAAEKLLALADGNALLGGTFRALAARALLDAGDPERAAREADRVGEGFANYASAVLTAAEAHLAAGRAKEAGERAANFVRLWPLKPSAAAALWISARVAERLGRAAEARAAEKRIYIEYPASAHASRLAPPPELGAAEAVERASRLIQIHRNARATSELEAVLARRPLDATVRCKASYYLGAAEQRRRRHARANAAFRIAARVCKDGFAARSLFLWGKGLLSRRNTAPAGALLERVAQRFPKHRLADDALLLAAQAWRRAGDPRRAKAALERLLREIPDGDMAPKARYELARLALESGSVDEAVKLLTRMAEEDPYPADPYLRGRPLYTLGRVEERLLHKTEAIGAFKRCIKDHPLTYWAGLARGRLRALGATLESSATEAARPAAPDASDWPDAPETLTRSDSFRRGVALLRLGAGDLAVPELSQSGNSAGATEEVRATVSLVYYLAADWHRSHLIIRQKLKDVLARPPSDAKWRLFLLGYPKGFWDVLEPVARKYKVDPLLLISVVREESAFNASVESWANAVGLAQLILPTAQRIAQALKIQLFRREMLLDPKVNLSLGAKYLSNLLRRFKGSAPLAVAAYNAGELAVERWLRERGDRDLDEFVDAIPYEQTRLYTRRVMESYATYRYLYGKDAERLLVLGPAKQPPPPRIPVE